MDRPKVITATSLPDGRVELQTTVVIDPKEESLLERIRAIVRDELERAFKLGQKMEDNSHE